MSAGEVAGIKRRADLYNDLRLKDRYSELRVNGKALIGDSEVFCDRGAVAG